MFKRKYILPILLAIQIVAVNILSLFPEFIEKHYSNSIYVHISHSLRQLTGAVSFSIGDIIYLICLLHLARWLWISRKSWRKKWEEKVLQALSALSVFYFLFHLLWGLNYHRVTLHEKMFIQKEYSDEDLLAFTRKIIGRTNLLHARLSDDPEKKIAIPYSQQEVFQLNLKGYENLERQHQYFRYEAASTKPSLWSGFLSYMGFAGYLNPFTNEAQVNDRLPMFSFPATAAHEMAHQIGYASESEANFVGYLATIHNEDLYIQYSGYTLALRYCLGNWEKREKKIGRKLLQTVRPGIRKNFRESREFWKQYETLIETGFHIFYDNFLKLNRQDDGLESYSRFVDLLVNYYRDRPL